MYRLHIDIPLGEDQEEAIRAAKLIVQYRLADPEARERLESLTGHTAVNYRLGNDEDRQRSNYLDINENGHVSTRKTRIE